MSITINKYVDIKSGVGGQSGVAARQLIGRYITTSSAILPGTVVEFTSLDDVETYFSDVSPEYQAAAKYFAFVSKLNTGASKLSMASWTKVATAPSILGASGITGSALMAAIIATTDITFNVTDTGGVVTAVHVSGLDFSAATSYEEIRATLQTALRANANPQLVNCTVNYTASTGRFSVVGSVPGNGTAMEAVTTSTVAAAQDAAVQMGLLASSGAQNAAGKSAQTPTQAVIDSTNISDNFGSFGFIDSTTSPPTQLAQADVVNVATWNATQNVKFMYCTPSTVATAQDLYTALQGIAGTAVTISNNDGADFAEFIPMEILAATDYTRVNASQNYMFYEFDNRAATVTDTDTSDAMDAVRSNYNGQVMKGGQQLAFYQRGVLMGDNTAPTDMNTYGNEMWLKDDIITNVMNAFLALPRIPATDTGRALVLSNIQTSIDSATKNGTISVGKVLTNIQKQYITGVTGDPNAWQQIQNIGYWIDVQIVSYQTVDGRTEYMAQYVLVYSKDDQVRKVEGSDILI